MADSLQGITKDLVENGRSSTVHFKSFQMSMVKALQYIAKVVRGIRHRLCCITKAFEETRQELYSGNKKP